MAPPSKHPKADVTALPDEVLDAIMASVASKPWPAKERGTTMLALSCVNSNARRSLLRSNTFADILRELEPNARHHCSSPREAVALACGIGCEICKKKRIRKVYWEFNVRCCSDCFKTHTINEFYLSEPAAKKLIAGLPHVLVSGYNPNARTGHREWTAKYLWRPQVMELVQTQGSYDSIEAYVQAATQARLAQQALDRMAAIERGRTRHEARRLFEERGVSAETTRLLPDTLLEFSEDILERMLRLENALREAGLRPSNVHKSKEAESYLLGGGLSANDAAAAIRAELGSDVKLLDTRVEAIAAQKEARKAATARRSRLGARLKRRGLEFVHLFLKDLDYAMVNSISSEPEFVKRASILKATMEQHGIEDPRTLEGSLLGQFLLKGEMDVDRLSEILEGNAKLMRKKEEWTVRLSRAGITGKCKAMHAIDLIKEDVYRRGEEIVIRVEAFAEKLRENNIPLSHVSKENATRVIGGTATLDEVVNELVSRRTIRASVRNRLVVLGLPVEYESVLSDSHLLEVTDAFYERVLELHSKSPNPRIWVTRGYRTVRFLLHGGPYDTNDNGPHIVKCPCGNQGARNCILSWCSVCCREEGKKDDNHICSHHNVNR